jgi:tRNA(His) 5'-end guanylyltransferase
MKKNKDSLGDRMKSFYENRCKTSLIRRMPVVIRLDGRSFHVFTRGFAKPFDKRMIEAMQETTLELCKSIQGCVFGYTQSDEITLILVDYNAIDVSAWYDYEVQKMCSVAASMATLAFNRIFHNKIRNFVNEHYKVITDKETYGEELSNSVNELLKSYNRAIEMGAMFDARCFNVPQNDLLNAVLWRIKDATRNSINSLGQAWFKHKELEGKSTSQVQDMLFEKYGINWNNLSTVEKRGTAIIKDEEDKWIIDEEMPILTGENRSYVESRIVFGDDKV